MPLPLHHTLSSFRASSLRARARVGRLPLLQPGVRRVVPWSALPTPFGAPLPLHWPPRAAGSGSRVSDSGLGWQLPRLPPCAVMYSSIPCSSPPSPVTPPSVRAFPPGCCYRRLSPPPLSTFALSPGPHPPAPSAAPLSPSTDTMGYPPAVVPNAGLNATPPLPHRRHLRCAARARAPAPGDPEPPTPDVLLAFLATAAGGGAAARGPRTPHRPPPPTPPPLPPPTPMRYHSALRGVFRTPDEPALVERLSVGRLQGVAEAAATPPPPVYAPPEDHPPPVAATAAASATVGATTTAAPMGTWDRPPAGVAFEADANAAPPRRCDDTPPLQPAAAVVLPSARPLARAPLVSPLGRNREAPRGGHAWRATSTANAPGATANVGAIDGGGAVDLAVSATRAGYARPPIHHPAQRGPETAAVGWPAGEGGYPIDRVGGPGGECAGASATAAGAAAEAMATAAGAATLAAAAAATAMVRAEWLGAAAAPPNTPRSEVAPTGAINVDHRVGGVDSRVDGGGGHGGRTGGGPASASPPLPLVCPRSGCTFATRRRSQLTRHHNRVHLRLKPHACGVCGRHFASRSDRKKHAEAHHRGMGESREGS